MASTTLPGDPRLAVLRDLGRGAASSADELVLEGELVLARARAAGVVPSLVVATASVAERLPAFDARTQLLTMDERAIGELAGFEFHRGVLAVAERPAAMTASAAIAALCEHPRLRLLALDRIADAANLGAVLRCARAFDIGAVLLGPGCADAWSRRCLRASMGHGLSLSLSRVDDLAAAMQRCRAALPGLRWWSTRGDGDAPPLGTIAAPDRLGLVLGNEGDGVSTSVTAVCDAAVRIVMAAEVDSLNVGAAAAVLLWALRMA